MMNNILGLAFLFLAIVLGIGAAQLSLGFYGFHSLYNADTVMTYFNGSMASKTVFASLSSTLIAITGLGMLLQPQT